MKKKVLKPNLPDSAIDKDDAKSNTVKSPPDPADEDIYNSVEEEKAIDPESISKQKALKKNGSLKLSEKKITDLSANELDDKPENNAGEDNENDY